MYHSNMCILIVVVQSNHSHLTLIINPIGKLTLNSIRGANRLCLTHVFARSRVLGLQAFHNQASILAVTLW